MNRICKLCRAWLARLAYGSPLMLVLLAGTTALAYAHGVSDDDKSFIEGSAGINLIPYIYLGAKHMVTGYDHLLFLFGVIFFLYRLKDVGRYVTLFAVGHSTTLLFGVIANVHANPYLIDAVIGLSVVYKALDNLGAFRKVLGFEPNPRLAVLIFGFFHGFGLATKLRGNDPLARRHGAEHHRVQRRCRGRSVDRSQHDPDRDDVLAPFAGISAPRIARQRGVDERGLRTRRLSALRLFLSHGGMT